MNAESQTLVVPVSLVVATGVPFCLLLLSAIAWFARSILKDITDRMDKLQASNDSIVKTMQEEKTEAKIVGARVISHDTRLQTMDQRLLALEQRPWPRGKR